MVKILSTNPYKSFVSPGNRIFEIFKSRGSRKTRHHLVAKGINFVAYFDFEFVASDFDFLVSIRGFRVGVCLQAPNSYTASRSSRFGVYFDWMFQSDQFFAILAYFRKNVNIR
jgi:hypothetical protein